MLRRTLVVVAALSVLAPAGATQPAGPGEPAEPGLDALWGRVEAAKRKGELDAVLSALDALDHEVSRRVAVGLLDGRSDETRTMRGRIAGLRRWLEPQLPYYRRLAKLADRVEADSRAVNLWEGSAATLLAYGRLLGELDQAESLAASFRKAFPGALETRPIRKLAAAHGNLARERRRALARWAASAADALDRAASADLSYVPVDLYRTATLLRILAPGSEEAQSVAARVAALRAEAKPASAFPALSLPQYADLAPLLRAAVERLDPAASVRRLSVSDDLAGWADPLAGTEHQSVGTFVLLERDGACRAVHAILDRGRPAQGAWGPWAVRTEDALGALPCDGAAAPDASAAPGAD